MLVSRAYLGIIRQLGPVVHFLNASCIVIIACCFWPCCADHGAAEAEELAQKFNARLPKAPPSCLIRFLPCWVYKVDGLHDLHKDLLSLLES
jgi:hypothetical protein